MQNQFLLTPFFLDQYSPGLEVVSRPGWEINRPSLPEAGVQQRMAAYHRPLADFVAATLARGQRPVSLAGDCLSSIAVMAGLQRAGLDPFLIWLDAHGDFNTWETTPSGFLGGMPLAMLVGRGEQTLPQAVGLHPVPESRVILCDGRDLDPQEKLALAASQVTVAGDIQSLPTHPLLSRPLYIHFDTDIVDPQDAPAMGYFASGGPSAETVSSVFQTLAKTCTIAAVSVSAWRPELDADGRTREVCMSLLQDLINPATPDAGNIPV